MNRFLIISVLFVASLFAYERMAECQEEASELGTGVLLMKLDSSEGAEMISEQVLSSIRVSFGETGMTFDPRSGEIGYGEMAAMAECSNPESDECRATVGLYANAKEYIYGQIADKHVRLAWYKDQSGLVREVSREVLSAGDSHLLSLELLYGRDKAAELFANSATAVVYLPLDIADEGKNPFKGYVAAFEEAMKGDLRTKHFMLDETEERAGVSELMMIAGCVELNISCYRDLAQYLQVREMISGSLDDNGVLSVFHYSAVDGLRSEVRQLVRSDVDARRVSEKLLLGDMGDFTVYADRGTEVVIDGVSYGFTLDDGVAKFRIPVGEYEVLLRKPGHISYGPNKVKVSKVEGQRLDGELTALPTHPKKKVFIGVGSGMLGVGALVGIWGAIFLADTEQINKDFKKGNILNKFAVSEKDLKNKDDATGDLKDPEKLHKKFVTIGGTMVGIGSALVVGGVAMIMYGAMKDFYAAEGRADSDSALGMVPSVNVGFNGRSGSLLLDWRF